MKNIQLVANYELDLSLKSPIKEYQQKEIIIRELADNLSHHIIRKPGFFSEEVLPISETHGQLIKRFHGECFVLTKEEYFQLVEEIKLSLYGYKPNGYMNVIDND